MRYRPDIDGIRTLAVVPVVLYHAGFWPFTGGFVGVDVFFVISGYLITNILLGDIREGNFSIGRFYVRRIRRIFPALFLVLFLSAVAAYFILLPSYFEDFSEGVFATTLFASNFQFWRESGYFDNAAELNPLLHTWSLAVEEQFYIFFPVLLAFFYKRSLTLLGSVLVAITVLSFALSVYFVQAAPDAAFFLTPMRVWELMAGCLLAIGMVPRIADGRVAEAVAVAGVAMIAVAVFGFDSTTPFPGAAALLPVLGTMMLIHTGENVATFVGRVLSTRVFVFIGLISYSLYLFHWPIFVFYRHLTGEDGSLWVRGFLVLLAGFLAWLSWRFFEQPFRQGGLRGTSRQVFAAGGAVAAAFLAFGFLGNVLDGWTFRYDYRFDPVASMRESKEEAARVLAHARCRVVADGRTLVDGAPCDTRADGRKRVLILGDSHASHIYPGLVSEFPDMDFHLYGAGGCRLLVGTNTREDKRECALVGPYVFDVVLPSQHFDAIILSGKWMASDVKPLAVTVEYLKRYVEDITVVGPVPRYKVNLPEALAVWRGSYSARFFELNEERDVEDIDSAIALELEDDGVTYISLYRNLCQARICRTFGDDGTTPIQWDRAHLSISGSAYVARHIMAPVLRDHVAFRKFEDARHPAAAVE